MSALNNTLLFPSEHTDVVAALHDLNVRSKIRPQLRTFLASSSTVVHEQAASVEGPDRGSIPPFQNLVDLAEKHVGQQRQDAVLELVLLTVIQISQLLVYVLISLFMSYLTSDVGLTNLKAR